MLSAPVPAFTQEFRSGKQGEAGGRGVWGEFRPPSPASSVRIFSNRHRTNFVCEFRASTKLSALRKVEGQTTFYRETASAEAIMRPRYLEKTKIARQLRLTNA
ncbi:MAG: hypothetical protein A3C80_00885 [Candidatus Ryanbacteria bacterium RIFCSPHIGHO2_02_FULL_45_43]|nr:MAG: hypothetical protein A3C80_00885 [Candidatus Ryanbacteria bacterium RIFCSPHIGHO2_02_FULL_45_43]OGZ53846.1 MAG: hypothetical protein A3H62_01980 [Candidatus Ryanbacteria bacterium RIFCSPLOWO2_02_FULL_44_40]